MALKRAPARPAPLPARCIAGSRWLIATARWWRPVTGWVCVVGLIEHMIVLPAIGVQASASVLLAHYGVIAAALALRSYDKTKGTAVDSGWGGYSPPNTPIAEG